MPSPSVSLPHIEAGMRRACDESRRFMGASSPNPSVGAAALSGDGQILAVAAHQKAGNDHGEAALLKICQERGLLEAVDTLCVTLEPCNHTGRTPPCSEAIIASGIQQVAIGLRDPNPAVQGGGAARLRAAGISVIENIESDLCARAHHAFLYSVTKRKPFVTVKRAFDRQGSMIPPLGHKTFTSQESLTLAHRLRKKSDALITGSGTVLADAPLFNVRHVVDYPSKKRVLAILDRQNRVPQSYIDGAKARNWTVCRYNDLDECFSDLQTRGMQDILVESGPLLTHSILESSLWTLKVDILAGNLDLVKVEVKPGEILPFDISGVDIATLLPL